MDWTRKVNPVNANSQILTRWTPEKGTTTFGRDVVGRVRTNTYHSNPKITFSYDSDGRLTNMADGIGTNSFSYSPAGQLQSDGGLWPNDTVSRTYNNRLGMVTKEGMICNLRKTFPMPLILVATVCLLAANVLNIGADLAGMADAMDLLLAPIPKFGSSSLALPSHWQPWCCRIKRSRAG